ncbi:MAG: hypothetical protein LBG65_03225 [Puniceicoccales bacterium]|jgi:hypothetical protein|nr:hypothetical protein [Puniceicoccales bacterium]
MNYDFHGIGSFDRPPRMAIIGAIEFFWMILGKFSGILGRWNGGAIPMRQSFEWGDGSDGMVAGIRLCRAEASGWTKT